MVIKRNSLKVSFFFQNTMGKNKKKVNSVFKVAGAKSLKLKAKAKAVKHDLKNVGATIYKFLILRFVISSVIFTRYLFTDQYKK